MATDGSPEQIVRREASTPPAAATQSTPTLVAAPPPALPVRPITRSRRRPREPEPTVSGVLWTLWSARWQILVAALCAVALGVAYVLVTPPAYEATALVQVIARTDRNGPLGFQDLSSVFPDQGPAQAEGELIRSRSLLGPVISSSRLDVVVTPRRLPVLGAALARRHHGEGVAQPPPFVGMGRYAWGGEVLELAQLDLDDALLDEPLTLTVLEGGRYRLAHGAAVLLEGTAGVPERSPQDPPRVRILVSRLLAREGTQFTVERRRLARAIELLQRDLRIEELPKKPGMLSVALEGPDPARTAATLNAVLRAYVAQNLDRYSAEAVGTLRFLDAQLPALKADMERAEAALKEHRRRNGQVNLSMETQRILERTVELEKTLSQLAIERADLQQQFTDQHPAMQGRRSQVEAARAELDRIHQDLNALPQAEAESARYVRDVTVSTDLYLTLLRKAQELRVVRSAAAGTARLVDPPLVPYLPVRPRAGVVLPVALFFGLGIGVVLALGRRSARGGSEDPREIEARTGIPVVGAIPRSRLASRLARRAFRPGGGGPGTALVSAAPGDVAVESFRTLRSNVLFALMGTGGRVVTVTGPGPAVGKSFVATNLAHLLASDGRRVLLVDADLRRERPRRRGATQPAGVAEVVAGEVTLDQALQPTSNPALFLLGPGGIPADASEVATSKRFEALLATASSRFDVVVVDTPPLLAVADAVLAARIAAVNLLVLRYGRHSVSEVGQAVALLEQAGAGVDGAVLNDVREEGGRYGRYGRYYRYPA